MREIETNLPATRPEPPAGDAHEAGPLERRRPLSVAFLPLALITFILLAFVMAAWTFLAAAT